MTDVLTREELAERLAEPGRVVVLYSSNRELVRAFDASAPECLVPMVRVRKHRAPKLAYYEHGEELESVTPRGAGDVERFLEHVDGLQERWRVIRGKMRLDKFG